MHTIEFIWPIVLALFFTFAHVPSVRGASFTVSPQNQTFLVKVVGFEDGLEFMTQHSVSIPDITPKTISNVVQQPNAPRELFRVLLQEKTSREEARRQAIKKFNLTGIQAAKWVASSPDGKHLLVGFEDRQFDVMRNLVVVETVSLKTIRKFSYSGSTYVLDAEWSLDSQLVAILYTRERWSLAPLDILKLLSGHGVSLNTIGLNFFNVSSGAMSETLIAKDIRFGTGTISRVK